MRLAIVGTGRMGSGLARVWRSAGHEIVLGVRNPSAVGVRSLATEVDANVVEIAEVGRDVDAVVLTIPHAAVDEAVFSLGPLAEQIVIDCTNAVRPGFQPEFDYTTSAAEELQAQIPAAYVYKSFNAQGAETLGASMFGEQRASNFYCGPDGESRRIVHRMVEDAGFDPVYVGGLDRARQVESLMLLWVAVAQQRGHRSIAFKLLERFENAQNV